MKKRVFIVFIFLFSIGFSQTTSIEYLIVAGGGGGASGGGGAGGVLQSTNYSIPMNTDISVIVGAGGSFGTGGAGSSGAIIGGNGGNSSINGTITALGGGGGGNSAVNGGKGANGGSGGGGSYDRPSVSYSSGEQGQGNRGGRSDRGGYGAGGGGGGAGENGYNAPAIHQGGPGGDGIQSSISGTANYYGGGGGGGVNNNCSCSVNNGGGQGGLGGGGNGSSLGYGNGNYNNGTSGTPNTGGGGGGTDPESTTANDGGSGIVIIRYLGMPSATGGTISQVGGYTIHTFLTVGNSTFRYNGSPQISQTKIALDNSSVSVTFSDAVYGGSGNSTSTLEVSDFELSISGGSASLSSSTPSSIIVSGTTIGLGIPLSGTPDGDEILTILPVSNAVFSVSGETVSTTQSNNTTELVPNIVTDDLVLYLDATNTSSYPGTGTVWYDLSGNENNFNLNGPTHNSSGYFDFDGSNDWARTISTLDLSSYDYITVQIILFNENNSNLELTFEHSENWNSNIGGFGLANQSGGSTYLNNIHHTNHDRGGIYRNYEANILNEWHLQTNIFSSVNDSTGRLAYLDNNLLDFTVQPTGTYPTATSTTNSLSFGDYHFYISSRAGANYFLNGKVKSVLIYGAKLNSNTVYQNYDAFFDIPPTNLTLSANTISETLSIGSVVGTLSATDSDTSSNQLTLSFATGDGTNDADNTSFTISGTSLLTSTTLDYETKTSYNIYINVNDGANNYAKAFTVSVTNVLEPITDLGFEVANIVSDGLILHLDASNTESYPGSGDIWNDISGNNYHSSIIGGSNFSNKQIILDGSDNYVKTPRIPGTGNSNQSHTMEIIVTPNSTSGNLISMTNSSNHGGWNMPPLPSGNSKFYAQLYSGILNNNSFSYPFNLGEKYHLTLVWDNSGSRNFKFYVNNNLIAQQPGAAYSSSNSDNFFFLGEGNPGCCRSVGGVNSNDFAGKFEVFRVYNRALTDAEVASNYSALSSSSPSTSTLSIDEEVSIGTQVGTLTATDSDTTSFTFSLVSGNGTNDQHNALFTVSGTQLLVAGNIDYETNSTLNIYVQASDGTNTFSKSLTVNVNDINEPPVITETTLSNDNSSISVTFSEAVNASADVSNTLALEVSDFALSINGGTATLSSATPSSISVNGNTFTLGLPVSGSISGSETVTVVPIINAIYDAGAATASTTQTNNTVSLHGDSDSDGVNDALDQCPNTPGGASVDVNGCAESQKDPDNDGITGINDNCPNTANSNQMDTDGDGLGDLCDPDIDGDGIVNASDNCPSDYNPDQKNNDNDNQGDLCDLDDDNDGYNDLKDFFPFDPLEWLDTDRDGIGNNADTDDDNDDFIDTDDAFPLNPREWADNDKDGIGDNKDPDDDNDGVEDKRDAFPMDDSEYLDTDKDGIGNNADEDDDGDGYKDQDEIACDSDPLKRFSKPRDYDGDLIPDCIDTDDDDDGCLDEQDLFPLNERECEDSDGDGIGDNSDIDADNDGVINQLDDFPTDPDESKDTDGDGIGDNADLDDNNDGFPEDTVINSAGEEVIPIFVSELLTPNQTGEESKWRIVNIDKYPTANVKVYSPSGIIVYESWEYNNDWSGKDKKGRPLPNGPYLYIIDRGDETLIEEGWLYIFN